MPGNVGADTRRMREIKRKPFPWYVLESLLFENGYQAVLLYRLAHWFRSRRVPVMGPLIHRFALLATGVDIAPGAVIGPGLRISHGVGIVVGAGVRIGRDALLMQGVTLGAPSQARIDQMPTLGDRVVLGAGATVIGGVKVGDDVLIGVHCVVTQNVPAGAKVLPAAPQVVERGVPAAPARNA
jgi:serine O-acetyltransferase